MEIKNANLEVDFGPLENNAKKFTSTNYRLKTFVRSKISKNCRFVVTFSPQLFCIFQRIRNQHQICVFRYPIKIVEIKKNDSNDHFKGKIARNSSKKPSPVDYGQFCKKSQNLHTLL